MLLQLTTFWGRKNSEIYDGNISSALGCWPDFSKSVCGWQEAGKAFIVPTIRSVCWPAGGPCYSSRPATVMSPYFWLATVQFRTIFWRSGKDFYQNCLIPDPLGSFFWCGSYISALWTSNKIHLEYSKH